MQGISDGRQVTVAAGSRVKLVCLTPVEFTVDVHTTWMRNNEIMNPKEFPRATLSNLGYLLNPLVMQHSVSQSRTDS